MLAQQRQGSFRVGEDRHSVIVWSLGLISRPENNLLQRGIAKQGHGNAWLRFATAERSEAM